MKLYYLKPLHAVVALSAAPNVLNGASAQDKLLLSTDSVLLSDVAVEYGPEIRFSQKVSFDDSTSLTLGSAISDAFPLSKEDFPLSQALANLLQNSNCPSVTLPDDYEVSHSVKEMVELVGGSPTHAPQKDFWPLFREVVSYQSKRREFGKNHAMKVMPWLNLPELWRNLTVNEVGEAVHNEFPGYHQMRLLEELMGQGLEIDNALIPKRCEKQFLHGPVMVANLNTWSIDMVAPTNFAAKYFEGRARPEEVAWAITCSQEGFLNKRCDKSFKFDLKVVPSDIVDAIAGMKLTSLEDFSQYREGAPRHPSWPAMHSAASNMSLWLPVVMNLTPGQWLEAKRTDLAVAMARTVAGVHYKDDNLAGLVMGQEILARELPQYLAFKYGADAIKVKEKIESLRFDWRETMIELLGQKQI